MEKFSKEKGEMSVPGGVYELVKRFDRNREEYRSGRFNETQVRVDFIDPLMGLLGWDVYNREGRPAATLTQRREYLRSVAGLRVSESTVSRLLRRLGWTRKNDRWVRANVTGG